MNWQMSMQLMLGSLELDLDIQGTAEPVALVGPNGSGKTTVLRTIAGAFTPDAGHFQLGSQVLFDSKEQIDLVPEERAVGYVPQGYGLFPHLRVIDNVAFGLRGKQARDERRLSALKKLEDMGCAKLANRWPGTLSGGERQCVALARTLITEPNLLLLDEPFAALDVSARRNLRGYLAEHLERRSVPTIMVTHDIRDVVAVGARMIVLEQGRVVQIGSVDELRINPVNEFVAEFCHSENRRASSSD
jgi:molybdate transport system ATP-binding protein